jgi:hypothetical protein
MMLRMQAPHPITKSQLPMQTLQYVTDIRHQSQLPNCI